MGLILACLLALVPSLAFAQPPVPVSATASLTTSTCPGSGCVVLNVGGYGGATIQITGTWSGTVTFEGSTDGTTPANGTYASLQGWSATSTTANGLWMGPVGGVKYLRVRFSTASSGTAVVTLMASLDGSALALTVTPSGAISVTQGTVPWVVSNAGTFATQAAQSGTWTVQPGNTQNSTAWLVTGLGGTFPATQSTSPWVVSNSGTFAVQPEATATTTNGAATCYLTSTASTNATNCKASAGNVYAIRAVNTTTTNYFLRMYNLSASPTCSSATGFVETVPVLGASANGGGIATTNATPQAYGTGIGFCLTGGGSSTDNTNAATGVYLTILYK